jgi:hypothetical protein
MMTKAKSAAPPRRGDTVRVYPVEGRTARDPETGRKVPAEGVKVAWSAYWRRLVDDGDVTLTAPRAPSKPAAKPQEE